VSVFLKLDGIEGESTDARHAKEIDVTAWSFGVTNPGGPHSGGGSGTGRATFTDVAVTKVLDKATPALLLAVASGRHIAKGRLTVTSAGPHPIDILVVDLQDVLVTTCVLADTADDGRPVENVAFSFTKIRVGYIQQAATGAAGQISEFAWDLAAGHA
jgi:type VI secretion system secreted protein Hcp